MNSLHRLKNISKSNNFKAACIRSVQQQFLSVKLALKETRKFEKMIGTTVWPETLCLMKIKITQSPDFDDELCTHDGNGHAILPYLMQEYRILYPEDAVRLISMYNSNFGEGTDNDDNKRQKELDKTDPNVPQPDSQDICAENPNSLGSTDENSLMHKYIVDLPQEEKISPMVRFSTVSFFTCT